jgi:hypothetical protein
MSRIRSKLTYANVMATLAVFIALGGGTTAVALSGTNTVFTDDIANDTQPAGGGNPKGGLAAVDLRPNSVGSSEVTNGSLGTGDLAAAARGARAYAHVASNGDLAAGATTSPMGQTKASPSSFRRPAISLQGQDALRCGRFTPWWMDFAHRAA